VVAIHVYVRKLSDSDNPDLPDIDTLSKPMEERISGGFKFDLRNYPVIFERKGDSLHINEVPVMYGKDSASFHFAPGGLRIGNSVYVLMADDLKFPHDANVHPEVHELTDSIEDGERYLGILDIIGSACKSIIVGDNEIVFEDGIPPEIGVQPDESESAIPEYAKATNLVKLFGTSQSYPSIVFKAAKDELGFNLPKVWEIYRQKKEQSQFGFTPKKEVLKEMGYDEKSIEEIMTI
jgi:hypothetical protein